MAGLGSRFRAKGWDVPKYAIEVRGRTMFAWAMESLRHFLPLGTATFVVRAEDRPEEFLRRELRPFGVEDPAIVPLDHVTDGQATTVLLALRTLRGRERAGGLVVYNIDTYVEPHAFDGVEIRGDGWIPVFRAPGTHWSFARLGSANRVLEVAEKRRISEWATVGLYYFRSFRLFEACYRLSDYRGYREKFVAPLYQTLLSASADELTGAMGSDSGSGAPLPTAPVIFAEPLDASLVHVLGTPQEVVEFAPEFATRIVSHDARIADDRDG